MSNVSFHWYRTIGQMLMSRPATCRPAFYYHMLSNHMITSHTLLVSSKVYIWCTRNSRYLLENISFGGMVGQTDWEKHKKLTLQGTSLNHKFFVQFTFNKVINLWENLFFFSYFHIYKRFYDVKSCSVGHLEFPTRAINVHYIIKNIHAKFIFKRLISFTEKESPPPPKKITLRVLKC